MTARRYHPWTRSGIAGAISTVDPLTGPVPARATLTVTTAVNGGRDTGVPVRLYGPGDVLGFDARQVLRREPGPDTPDAEPNYFTLVEFTRPDLPWLFTPAAPNADRLRPWIVLVVVRRDRVTLDAAAGSLPVLRVADATRDLPDLTESWAWAHTQTGTGELSRLTCPRMLEAGTRYLAAVVPAFELGRRAGLGMPVDEAATTSDPAWTATTGAIDLPAYLWWEFVTGAEGDFQALASRLTRSGATAPAGRPFTVEDLPGGLPDLEGWQLPGALGALSDPSPPSDFGTAMAALLDAPGDPLPPPSYGHRHIARRPSDPAAPAWLRRLNLDPRYRAAAALGANLVRDHQEDLMAAAWRQAGEIEAANRLLRLAQLARGAGGRVHDRLALLPAEQLLLVTAALHTRVLTGGVTVASVVAASRVPAAMTGGAYRRVLRPRGPLARRTGQTAAGLLTQVNDDLISVRRPPARPTGTVTPDDVNGKERTRLCEITDKRLAEVARTPRGHASPAQWKAFVTAAAAHQRDMPGCQPVAPPARPALDLPKLRADVLAAADPDVTVTQRLHARLTLPPRPAGDPLEPVWAAPRFDTPLARDLIALSPDHLLPGIAGLPPNSVTALPTNPRFVEALMTGANHEMNAELLWRGFPTDQRGTPFRRFWDRSGSVTGPADDIPAIDGWTGDLGDHLTGGEQVCLVIRGEVLHRYPRTVVYAARARWQDGRRVPVIPDPAADPAAPGYPEVYPVFSGSIPPDVTFLGFALDPDVARGDPDPAAGDPGWFFVLQQPPAEPRLGLDATSPDAATSLSWDTVARTASDHVNLAGGLTGVTVPGWGVQTTSAVLARLTEQLPFRICIHASDLFPTDNS
ncbi:hypothetical protein [Actinoplanes subglobosus]|uniref:Uncharacterized protein n=1 Tax=Actinoplanes subglobosus TaxID=1547892 RepID=A0ABV8IT75_9ACTN